MKNHLQRRQGTCIEKICVLLYLSWMISLTLICSAVGPARAESQQQDTSPAFTNRDLEQYRPAASDTPSQSAVSAPTDHTAEKRQKTAAIVNKKEQERWCKKSRQVKKSLALAKDKVDEHTARLHELEAAGGQVLGKKRSGLEKQRSKAARDLKAATKRLRDRQETLAELEDDAHRNNIPPGWLRCQFE
ncbi:MAG: hypothetical protein WA610_02750 [Thermodesulfovibrionales bacterium]